LGRLIYDTDLINQYVNVPNWAYKLYHFHLRPALRGTPFEDRVHKLLVELTQRGIPEVDESEAEGVYERDWDNLIILDACRHDSYEEALGRRVESRVTLGSNSRDFIRENFSERDCSDTVYVSGNAHTQESVFEEITGKRPGDVFHEIFQVHSNNWVDGEGTDPEAMIRQARTAAKLFPEKKLIVHLMKPHLPFLGREEDKEITWDKVRRGEVSSDRGIAAYHRNLEYALEELVPDLLDFLGGRTVITADHGQFLGENNRWAHPGGRSEVPLREVPWDEV
jgi:hypothetical protein